MSRNVLNKTKLRFIPREKEPLTNKFFLNNNSYWKQLTLVIAKHFFPGKKLVLSNCRSKNSKKNLT